MSRFELILFMVPQTPTLFGGSLIHQFFFHQTPDFLKDLSVEAELGIVTLYNAEHLRRSRLFFPPECSSLAEQEYQEIRKVFREYREKLAEKTKE